MDDFQFAKRDELFAAILHDDRWAFSRAIANGADIMSRNNDTRSTLHEAVVAGRPEMVQIVIDCGADLDAQDDMGITPLHFAALLDHPGCAEVLLAAGANPTIRDDEGRLASQHAYTPPSEAGPLSFQATFETAENKWQLDRAAERRQDLSDIAKAARPAPELASAQQVQSKRQSYGRAM